MAVAVVQELVTKFGFLGSIKPLNEYNVSLGGSIKLLGGMYLALEGAASGFSLWADGVLTGVDALGALSKQTRVSVGNIQALSFAAEQSQSTSAAMESTIRGLTSTIGTAAIQGSADFSRLGISVRDAFGQVKTADTVLDEVRQRFRSLNLSMSEQEHFASALGIDTSLLQLLNRTDSEMSSLRDRARELGTLTEEQVEQADDYKKSLNSMWFSLNNVKQLIAVGVAPELGRMADNFAQLLADNREWIVSGIQATVRVMSDLLAAFRRLLPVFAVVSAGFLAMKIAALGFKTVLKALGKVPIILLITGIALAVDDLIVAFNGGNSVIAKFFKETFDVDIVKAMTSAFKYLLTYGINPIIDGFKQMWEYWTIISKAILSGGKAVGRIFGLGAKVAQGAAVDQALIDRIPMDAARPGTSQTDNRSVNQNVRINVRTNDPQAAGRAINDSLQRQLDNANAQLIVGGR
jgi:hypothetical protein